MKVSIFGLGYVGCVSAACLAKLGHTVVGVDTSKDKVRDLKRGKATIVEKGIEDLVAAGHAAGRIDATMDAVEAVAGSEISLICVGTPPDPATKHLSLDSVEAVAIAIGRAISTKSGFHTVAIRSTVPFGTNSRVTDIIGAEADSLSESAFGVVSNPEFLREGSAIQDFMTPPLTVLASKSDRAVFAMEELYSGIDAPHRRVSVGTAELLKYVNNSFHALKISFANEVGAICREIGVDSRELMDVFVSDTKLNTSGKYLRPGFAYGGSCLPKDLGAIVASAYDRRIPVPVLESIARSNEEHKNRAFDDIIALEPRRVCMLGLAFKRGTDDVRNSPVVDLTERLLGKGVGVSIYDVSIDLSRLVGKNKEHMLSRLPHIAKLMRETADDAIDGADIVVITNDDPAYTNAVAKGVEGVLVYDVSGSVDPTTVGEASYRGIAW